MYRQPGLEHSTGGEIRSITIEVQSRDVHSNISHSLYTANSTHSISPGSIRTLLPSKIGANLLVPAWHAAPVLAKNDLHFDNRSLALPGYFTNETLLVLGIRWDVAKWITTASPSAFFKYAHSKCFHSDSRKCQTTVYEKFDPNNEKESRVPDQPIIYQTLRMVRLCYLKWTRVIYKDICWFHYKVPLLNFRLHRNEWQWLMIAMLLNLKRLTNFCTAFLKYKSANLALFFCSINLHNLWWSQAQLKVTSAASC